MGTYCEAWEAQWVIVAYRKYTTIPRGIWLKFSWDNGDSLNLNFSELSDVIDLTGDSSDEETEDDQDTTDDDE